jgi:hypothetical protein
MRTLTPLDNALQDTRSPQDKFLSRVAKKINEVPDLNASQNASASFRFWDAESLMLINGGNAFRYFGSDVGYFLQFAQNPSLSKLNNVNAVSLKIDFLLQQKQSAGGFGIIADTNYSVDFYLSLFSKKVNTQIQPNNLQVGRDELLSFKLTITHQKDGVNPTLAFSLDRTEIEINLADYILSRTLINVAISPFTNFRPDFNTNPEKITKEQYDNILSEALGIFAFFGYDNASYTALTGNNKLHFDALFKGNYAPWVSSTATSGGATTLTDTTQSWVTNRWANYDLRITSGTGAGQRRIITSNTATVATVSLAWTTNPDATSVYRIEDPMVYIPAGLQFAIEGTLIYFGTGASYEPINP